MDQCHETESKREDHRRTRWGVVDRTLLCLHSTTQFTKCCAERGKVSKKGLAKKQLIGVVVVKKEV